MNNNNNNIDINDFICTPEIISRYVHYYKTGIDINKPPTPSTSTSISKQEEEQPKDKQQPQKQHTKKTKRQKTKHISPQILQTRRTIQTCCRDNNLSFAISTFYNAITQLIRLEPCVLYQLLNLCEGSFFMSNNKSTGKHGKVHVGTPRNEKKREEEEEKRQPINNNNDNNNNISLSQRLQYASQIHTILTYLQIPLNEVVYTALIRLYVRSNNYDKAEELLNEAERTQQCKVKLRMYSSLLRGYCCCGSSLHDGSLGEEAQQEAQEKEKEPTQTNLINALKVWKRMYEHSGGISSGHPNYKKHSPSFSLSSSTNTNNNKSTAEEVMKGGNDGNNKSSSNNDNNNKGTTVVPPLLFGEGISPKITLSEYEYTSLIQCTTLLHDVRVMERLLSNVADEILIPGKQTTGAIINWFRNDNNFRSGDGSSSSSALDYVTLPPRDDPTIGSVTNNNSKGWNIYRNCTVDTDTGMLNLIDAASSICKDYANNNVAVSAKSQQYKLQPVELTDRAWESMREMNKSIVLKGQVEGHVSLYQGGGKGKKRVRGGGGGGGGNNNNKQHQKKQINNNNNNNNSTRPLKNKNKSSQWRKDAWKNFETFINQHPFYDVVIDGANVGYYEQNFINAPKHINYNQIDWLVRHLLEGRQQNDDDQHRIILFLHERHFTSNLVPQYAKNELLPLWESNIAPYDKLTVYRTPSGMNDDWFWMHAALLNGGGSRYSGGSKNPNVLTITNDEMRDHHFQMLSDDSFVRWKERHQVHFDFGTWDEELQRRRVILTYPSLYSRRIQRIEPCINDDSTTTTTTGDGDDVGSNRGGGDAYVIPLPKKGDEKRYADGLHVAEEGVPSEETYVVIQRVV